MAGTATMRSGTWRGDRSARSAVTIRRRRSSSRVAPGASDTNSKQLAEPAAGVLQVDDEAVGDLGQRLHDGVELGGADADPAAVEGGVASGRR